MLTVIGVALLCGAMLSMLVFICMSVQVVRPIEVRLVERFGKYARTMDAGLHFIMPFVERTISVDMREQMMNVEPEAVITKDKLNVQVDAVVYYKVKDAKASVYNVHDLEEQLDSLTQTTIRTHLGGLTLGEAIEGWAKINRDLDEILDKETLSYGVDVIRVEVQKIEPPPDVVEAMNMVVKGEQKKLAAKELALAAETEADGFRMAAMKKAEGSKQAAILEAEGTAKSIELRGSADAVAIRLVNEAAEQTFKGGAIEMRKLDTIWKSIGQNSKVIVPQGSSLVNLIGDLAGLTNGSVAPR